MFITFVKPKPPPALNKILFSKPLRDATMKCLLYESPHV